MSRKKRQTSIANSIDIAGLKAQYDACCKELLSHKIILAHILCSTVKEFQNISPKEAVKYIEESKTGVDAVDAVTPDKIIGDDTENNIVNEGKRFFDIKFRATVPYSKDTVELIINIEIQRKYNPGYLIANRAQYYCSRLVSPQYGQEFANSDYDKIKKVYSIWICTNPDKKHSNSIIRYRFVPETIFGEANSEGDDDFCSLMNFIIVGVGSSKDNNYSGIIKLLGTLLSNTLSPQERKDILDSEFLISMSETFDKEVERMCNLSYDIEERVIAKEKRATVKSLNGRLPIEEIAEVTRLTVEEVKKILSE